MAASKMTGRVMIGMLVGVVLGILLMNYSPTGIQPGDKLKVNLAGGQTTELKVASEDKSEKLLDVLIEGEVRGQAVAEKPAKAGFVSLPDGGTAKLSGVGFGEAAAVLREAGMPAESVQLAERSGRVKVLPMATQLVYVIGELFLRLLRMVVIPLIVASVLIGIASLGDMRKLGKVGKQTLLFYFGSMLVAALIGMTFVNTIKPGRGLNWTAPAGEAGLIAESPALTDLILRIVPTNPIAALAEFDVLGILFFTIILGLAMLKLGKRRTAPVFNFFESLSDLMFVLIGWVMAVAPFGVGALIAYYVAIQNPQLLGTLLQSLGMFALTVAVALIVHFFVLLAAVGVLGRYSPLAFLRNLSPAMATAFGTDSSSATIPVTLASVRNMGVSKRISDFVVPVGATVNMDGTALYEATAALFFAQAYLVDLSIGQQALVALTAVLAAVGAAGIPSAGLVTMALVLTAVGLPLAGIGLLFAIDRPLDMMRTVVNVTGDAVTSRVVQTWNPDIRPEDDDLATEYEPLDPTASHDREPARVAE